MSENYLKDLIKLERLTAFATQDEFIYELKEMSSKDLTKFFQLEKYQEAIKTLRKTLQTSLELPQWADKRRLVDEKIKIIDGILQKRRNVYAAYVMDQQKKSREQKSRLEDALPKPLDINQIIQRLTAPIDEDIMESPAKTVIPETPVRHSSEKDELVLRKRAKPAVSSLTAVENRARTEHDDLSHDLVLLAKNLKQNNLAFQDLLKRDQSVIKESELLLNSNSAKFKKEHEGLKTFRATSWRSTKTTILMMFLLFAAFIVMYLLIKITSK